MAYNIIHWYSAWGTSHKITVYWYSILRFTCGKRRKHVTQKRNSGAGGWGGGVFGDQTACNRNHTCGTQLSTPPAVKCKYSKIPVIWLAWDKALAELPDILDYPTVPTLTYILASNFLLLPSTWAVQLIKVLDLGISTHWFRVLKAFFRVFCSLHSWRIWRSRRQGSGDITTDDVRTLLVDFKTCPWDMPVSLMKRFFGKKQNIWS